MTNRLLIVHYAGDYREADRLRREEGKELYYGHGYVLDQLRMLREQHGETGFLCSLAPEYWEQLKSGVTVIGANTDLDRDPATVQRLIERYDPTHLVLNGPMMPLIKWAIKGPWRLGMVFADSFASPFRRYIRFRALPRLLNDSKIDLVANHGINAARALADLGVRADKILAWDFPHHRTPEMFAVRTLSDGPGYELFFAGTISEKKGVGDVIRAVALLRDRRDVRVSIAGAGQIDKMTCLAEQMGVADRVKFVGIVPNDDVVARMRRADAVVVPSRHSFPEGLPLTLYEGLASRTPVIASDHPMFNGHLVDRESAMVFPAGRPAALAEAIAELTGDAALYARVSSGAAGAWHHMQSPVKWGEMIDRWIRGSVEDRAWLADHAIGARAT